MNNVAKVVALAKVHGAKTAKVHFLPLTSKNMPLDTILQVYHAIPAAHHHYSFDSKGRTKDFLDAIRDVGIELYRGSDQSSYSLHSHPTIAQIINQPVTLDKATQRKVNKAVKGIKPADYVRAVERWHPHQTAPLGIKWIPKSGSITSTPPNLHGGSPVGAYEEVNGILMPLLGKMHELPPSRRKKRP